MAGVEISRAVIIGGIRADGVTLRQCVRRIIILGLRPLIIQKRLKPLEINRLETHIKSAVVRFGGIIGEPRNGGRGVKQRAR